MWVIKTGNDLTFHFCSGEKLSIIDAGMPKEICIEELENESKPIYILDPGNELAYMISYVTKVKN